MLHHDVITIVAMFTIVAIDHNCRNTNHNSLKKTTIVVLPTTIVAILLNHNCRNANHKCRNFIKISYFFLLAILYNMEFYRILYDPCITSYYIHNDSR